MTLDERVASLERTNRLLIRGLIACALAVLVLWWSTPSRISADSSAATLPANPTFEKVTARELSIVNAKGQEIAGLRTGRDVIGERGMTVFKMGTDATHVSMCCNDKVASLGVGGQGVQSWMSAMPGGDHQFAVVGAKNGEFGATLNSINDSRLVLSGDHLRSRAITLDGDRAQPAVETWEEHERKQRPNSLVVKEFARVMAQMERGEISQAEAAQRIAELSKRQAEE